MNLFIDTRQFRYPTSQAKMLRAGLDDIVEGFLAVHIWWQFGWHDVKQRYRRSVLGPFWLTLSTGIMVGALGFLYAQIFNQDVKEYLPFLTVGLIVWQFISTTIGDACQSFISAESLIKQVRAPLTVHLLRTLCRNFIIFLHQAVILIVVGVFLTTVSVAELLWIPLGLAAILANLIWIGLLLGPLCARFRDIPLIVQNIIQITFFITPILWTPNILGSRAWIADWNPFHHMIELIRVPMLTGQIPVHSWIFTLATLVIGIAIALPMFARTRGRIAYWV